MLKCFLNPGVRYTEKEKKKEKKRVVGGGGTQKEGKKAAFRFVRMKNLYCIGGLRTDVYLFNTFTLIN